MAVAIVFLVLLARGGGASDQQAIRTWFESPAGGGMPRTIASAIHVGTCQVTDALSQSRVVQKCPITTDEPRTPTLHTCFVFSGNKVLRGGWQLAALDACNAIRFDHHTNELIDVPARAHYGVLPR